MFVCITCKKCFNYQASLTLHQKSHQASPCYKCPVQQCDEQFLLKSALCKHLTVAHGQKRRIHKCKEPTKPYDYAIGRCAPKPEFDGQVVEISSSDESNSDVEILDVTIAHNNNENNVTVTHKTENFVADEKHKNSIKTVLSVGGKSYDSTEAAESLEQPIDLSIKSEKYQAGVKDHVDLHVANKTDDNSDIVKAGTNDNRGHVGGLSSRGTTSSPYLDTNSDIELPFQRYMDDNIMGLDNNELDEPPVNLIEDITIDSEENIPGPSRVMIIEPENSELVTNITGESHAGDDSQILRNEHDDSMGETNETHTPIHFEDARGNSTDPPQPHSERQQSQTAHNVEASSQDNTEMESERAEGGQISDTTEGSSRADTSSYSCRPVSPHSMVLRIRKTRRQENATSYAGSVPQPAVLHHVSRRTKPRHKQNGGSKTQNRRGKTQNHGGKTQDHKGKTQNGGCRKKCPVCAKLFNNTQSLYQHTRVVHQPRRFSCDRCQKSFSTRQNLEVHLAFHLGSKRFNCTSCNKTRYIEKHSLKCTQASKQSTDINTKSPKCSKHAKKSLTNKALKDKSPKRKTVCDCANEIRRPYVDKTAELSISGRSASVVQVSKRQTVNQPETSKGGETENALPDLEYKLSYSCNFCPQAFANKYRLEAHMRQHQESWYLCPQAQCGKTFQQKSSYLAHVKSHTSKS